jgi:asparagine synthase (glutamine-hydrolysing)
MCGIFGQYRIDGNSNHDLVRQMAATLAHRGPDGDGTYQSADGVLAFGAGRLAIIDLDAPAGPLFNEDDAVGVAFNGEIYNYRALRRELEAAGHVFATGTDTEVVVHGYEQWGADVLTRLTGMFALAVWDERERKLLLARDRTGEKPLYVAQVDGGLLFASEIKALLLHPNLRPAVNPDALPHFLAVGYTPPPLTMFAGVNKLAPGEMLTFDADGASTRRYHTFTMDTRQAPMPYAEAVTAVREALTQAVEMRLMADVPVGAFLSGGLDSTAVVALMAGAMGRPVETFTVGFDFDDDPHNDTKFNVDQRHGADAAAILGTHHHEITVNMGPSLADVFPHLVAAMDEPVAQHAIVQTAYVAALARTHDIPVLLSGDAADELFLGYTHYPADQQLGRYLALPRLLRRGLLDPAFAAQPWSGALQTLAHKSAHDEDAVRRYLAWMRVTGVDDAAALTDGRLTYADAFAPVEASLSPLLAAPQTPHFADRIAYTSLRRWVAEDSNMRVDKMTMLASVEARAPFQDPALIDLAYTLPLDYKLRDGGRKQILKDAVRGLVPDAVIDRRKRGFAPPSSEWMRGALRPLVDKYLSRDYVAAVGVFSPDEVARRVQAHHTRQEYHLWTVYPLLVFHLWHALYIDGSLALDGPMTAERLVNGSAVTV